MFKIGISYESYLMNKIKLQQYQYNYLQKQCKFFQEKYPDKISDKYISVFFSDEETENIREWAEDELQINGFDENYNPNNQGIILEEIIDLFYI